MATAYGSTSFRAQRPVVPSGAGGKGLALTNTKKDMEGNLIGADTPDLGPIGTNNPATVTSGNRLDQPATPLGRSAQSPSRPMALNLRSPVQPPATAVETPGKSNVVTGPPAPIRGAMSGYQDSASPSMAPRPTDSPAWDKKPATPAALVNPSGGQITGILAPDQQSGAVKINRLTGKPFGWRPGDADPSSSAMAAAKVAGGTPAAAAPPVGSRTPAQALEALKNGDPVPPTIAAAPSPAVAAPTTPAATPPTPAPFDFSTDAAKTAPAPGTPATSFKAAMPTPAQAMRPTTIDPGKPFDPGPYPTLPNSPKPMSIPSMTTQDQSQGVSDPASKSVPENGKFGEFPYGDNATPMDKYAALKSLGYTHEQAVAISGWKEEKVKIPNWQKGTGLGKLREAINF